MNRTDEQRRTLEAALLAFLADEDVRTSPVPEPPALEPTPSR